MTRPTVPPTRARRFEIEDLCVDWPALAYQVWQGPTYLRQNGRIAFVVIEHQLFSRIHPHQQALSTDELPEWLGELLEQGLFELTQTGGDD
ncbi:hypothetical protein [Pontivivens insulae]|uniref:Uncharacterized protein n=1 Tax=Pontivivens insulae TaxID=1639689 RepID=A0A2R8AGA7_9RHOB|nr:hypothetical protein [Pontivivens insulae]RED10686.1 hypothetical protein DFR53_3505 [Pontivivens insulae]SPF31100.1 hypothetical protein POI8812_03451 [Pontivivens insulae]